jgi:predicted acetyltransferase
MLLADAKEFGRTLGLDRILVTCSVDNLGSSRVIERNGGVFEDVVHDEESNENISRYWITL